MLSFDFWIQLAIVLVALFYGARKGGMALGLIGGIGLIILVFGFHIAPGKPPVGVILTILSVICASAALQAAGVLIACCKLPNVYSESILVLFAISLLTSAGSFAFSVVRVTLFTRCSRLSTTLLSRMAFVQNARWPLQPLPLKWVSFARLLLWPRCP